jgi:hypothetical protein
MKKIILSLSLITAAAISSHAQTWANATLDINQAKALVNSNGDLFWDYTQSRFEVPKGNGTNTIFAGALWVGGLDVGGQLHVAGQTYRQSGNDFYPGPVMNSASYSSATDAQWNKVWKINRSTIDSFRLGLFSSIPAEIATWPGNGNTALGQAAQLADYVDVDNDQVYNPSAGDYPCIKGDQALFIIFNDDRNVHTETAGTKLGFEFHAMLYAYSAPGTWLDTVVFLNYKMFNRSSAAYHNTYLGTWMDLDLGFYADDYVGCDVGRNTFYVYNGDANDGTTSLPTVGTFGANPPAQGVVFLRGPLADANDGIDNNRDGTIDEPGEVCLMNKFVYYQNDFTQQGNPENAQHHYNYLSGSWKDGTPLTYGGNGYGGSTPADFMFPGATDPYGWGVGGSNTSPNPQPAWDELTVGNMPGDRRGMASSGSFTMQPGASMCLDFAFVYGRGAGGPVSSVDVMKNIADSARVFYQGNSPCSCVINPLSVNEISHELFFQLYPNPASDNVTVLYHAEKGNATLEIYDMTGKMVGTEIISKESTVVDLKKFSPGIYLLRISDGNSSGAARVLKQ